MRLLPGLLAGLIASQVLADSGERSTQVELPGVPGCCRGSDLDIWMISTRGAACQAYCRQRPLRVYRLESDGSWQPASMDQFFQPDPDSQLDWIYVHGNRIERNEAVAGGFGLSRRLARSPYPIRFVIWSWPSEHIRGALRDVREKALRADDEAMHLAQWLSQYNAQRRVSLIGYSYGARIITGALHRLADGREGSDQDRSAGDALQARAVLIAAAMPNDWLIPGHLHGRAPFQADRILSLYNSDDPVLRRYHVVESCGSPLALGAVGVAAKQLGPVARAVQQRDVACLAGRTHSLDGYLAGSILNQVRRFCLWEE